MHSVISALALVQVGGQPTLWQNIVDSFPTDPASLVTLALAFGATIVVIVTGRSTSGKGKGKGGLSA